MQEQTRPDSRALRARGQRLLDDLAEDYLGRPDVSRGRMFASEGLAVRGKFFAFVGREGKLILKLPSETAGALVAQGHAEPVTIGKRTMREWVGLPAPTEGEGTWPALLAEAHQYVAALTGAASQERTQS